ncbi:fgf19 [Pungitius sinensis]
MLLLVVTVSVANMFLALGVVCLPLPDQGLHMADDWGQSVRLKHLYAASAGLHLLIGEDGQIQGSAQQSQYSLLEIRAVGPGCVVIRGVATARFLCIEGNGRLYSSDAYSREDCAFREQILPDGYNVYSSERHGALLSLGKQKQRLQGRDQGVPALAQFLPRISTLEASPDAPDPPQQTATETEEPVLSMDSFGRLSQVIHSPSFHER